MERDLVERTDDAADAGRRRLLHEVTQAGTCAHPIRLRGEAVHLTTGEVRPSSLRIACKDRRAVVCSACSYLYKADAWILVASGLAGGKGVPEDVREHPRLFVTLTAPSFGRVHRRTASGRCHDTATGNCTHGVPVICAEHHADDCPILGSPLCQACFDYEGAVMWNAQVARLWNRTIQQLRRELRGDRRLSRGELRSLTTLSYLKVAEFQKRGLVHLHVLLRADGSGDRYLSPPEWLSSPVVLEAVHRAVRHVSWIGVDGQAVSWGSQVDVIVLDATASDQLKIASYASKYAVKTTDGSLARARRFTSRRAIEEAIVSEHHRRLALAAWDLGGKISHSGLNLRAHAHAFGYRGQLITKSTGYSTTFRELRKARADFTRPANEVEPIEGTYAYDGRGYDDPRAARLAQWLHESQMELRREAVARRREVPSSLGDAT